MKLENAPFWIIVDRQTSEAVLMPTDLQRAVMFPTGDAARIYAEETMKLSPDNQRYIIVKVAA